MFALTCASTARARAIAVSSCVRAVAASCAAVAACCTAACCACSWAWIVCWVALIWVIRSLPAESARRSTSTRDSRSENEPAAST